MSSLARGSSPLRGGGPAISPHIAGSAVRWMCASIKPGMTKRPLTSTAPFGTFGSWTARISAIFRSRTVTHIRSCGVRFRPSMTRAFHSTSSLDAMPDTLMCEQAVADGFAESSGRGILTHLCRDEADRFINRLRAGAEQQRLGLVSEHVAGHDSLDGEHRLESIDEGSGERHRLGRECGVILGIRIDERAPHGHGVGQVFDLGEEG